MTAFTRCALFATTAIVCVASPAYAQTRSFDVPAQSLDRAVSALGRQADIQIVAVKKLTRGKSSRAVKGTMTAEQALAALLQGSGLAARRLRANSYTIVADPNVAGAVADATAREPGASSMGNDDEGSSGEDIVVTGTNIIGGASTASPASVYRSTAIDRSGRGSVQEFIQALPQNFNGGASEDTISTVTGGSPNATFGTGINLRGVGNDATLVLMNGRRLAPGNTSGNYVDISLIPLAALERVEIVADGASATYGSDAIGGVVNFILKRNFNGAETRARFGTVTKGSSQEYQAAQTIGHSWSSGSVLVSGEYFNRTALDAKDRDYVVPTGPGSFYLLPNQERYGGLLSLTQQVAVGTDVSADFLYSHRNAVQDTATPFYRDRGNAAVDSYSGTVGVSAELSNSIQAELSAGYSKNVSDTATMRTIGSVSALASDGKVSSSVASVDGRISGHLFSTPGGDVRYAVGVQFRSESLDFLNRLNASDAFNPDRQLGGLFAEANIPLFGRAGQSELPVAEISLAGRVEKYSDFGFTSNPKLGVIVRPTDGVKLRGTFGTSFKAPLLRDLNPSPFQIVAFPIFDPEKGSDGNAILLFGGNPDLKPERATTWSIGFDLEPLAAPGLSARVTYYHIDYRNRIGETYNAVPISEAFRQERILGPLLQRSPPQALVNQYTSSPVFANAGVSDLTAIDGVIDYRTQNLGRVKTSGIDFGASYDFSIDTAKVRLGVDGVYILSFDNQLAAGLPAVSTLNTPYNPVDLRLRSSASLIKGNFSGDLFLNYVGDYSDNRSGTTKRVSSWTTVDLSLNYDLGSAKGAGGGFSLAVGATNIFDRRPPFVDNLNYGVNYDGANADAKGRFIYIQVAKRW